MDSVQKSKSSISSTVIPDCHLPGFKVPSVLWNSHLCRQGHIPTSARFTLAYHANPPPEECTYCITLRTTLSSWLQTLTWWTHFLTITFREARYPWHAESTLNQISKSILAVTSARHIFLGTELHASRALHVHGLVAAPKGWRAGDPARLWGSDLWRRLFHDYGRSKVSPLQGGSAVFDYCTKYVTKALTSYYLL